MSIDPRLERIVEAQPYGSRWAIGVAAFAGACTVALFWEFAEFASDRFRGTTIQRGLEETMFDLVFGVIGAVGALLLWGAIGAARAVWKRG